MTYISSPFNIPYFKIVLHERTSGSLWSNICTQLSDFKKMHIIHYYFISLAMHKFWAYFLSIYSSLAWTPFIFNGVIGLFIIFIVSTNIDEYIHKIIIIKKIIKDSSWLNKGVLKLWAYKFWKLIPCEKEGLF